MTRHGKNNTSAAVYSYYERHNDTNKSGYGTQKARLNKDSIKDFDACSLTLQFCKNPVCTPQGILFDKEAILQYIVQKKVDIVRKVKDYDRQMKKEQKELNELADAAQKSSIDKFMKVEKGVVLAYKKKDDNKKDDEKPSVSNMQESTAKVINNFWIPTNTPSANETKLKKPDTNIYCPVTGEILKAKDLITVKFTLVDPDEKNLHTKKDRYKCPVTHDVLSNSIPCVVLKPSGNVVTMECYEKFIKKDMIDPITGEKLKESDIIPLQRGGTGFASRNDLTAEVKRPVMQA